ncbi:hypothetical protein K1719_009418 [Acacia pycnantha]|nr:hypothetical protein K1719_009418 [Acacia pycnantha]
MEFRENFDHAMVFHIDPIGSDHHTLLIDSCFYEEKTFRSFKFEAIWVQHEDFQSIVSEGWLGGKLINVDKMRDLINRLTVCRKKLMYWSKEVFPDFRKAIDLLRQRLTHCTSGVLTLEKLNEAEVLTRQIEDVWAKEESYWWQRLRISWLTCGDKNTKFFHNSVLQRRQRNKHHIDCCELRGVKLARATPTLSHCFLADDAILFANVEELNCKVLKRILDVSCEASG